MKALRTWTIVTLVLAILSLALVAVCLYRPVGFGEWMVITHEEITSEFGHTVDGAYDALTNVSIISFSILFILNQILHFCYTSKVKNNDFSAEKKSQNTTAKEESAVLKRVKKEKAEKVKKERKEKAKKIAKKVIEEVTEMVTEVETPEVKKNASVVSANQKLANFLDSFR